MKTNETPALPQTDFTMQVQVNAFDAKMFMAYLQLHMETCEAVGNKYEAVHYRTLLYKAAALFGMPITIKQG